MKKRSLTTTVFAVLSMALLLVSIFSTQALAADKIGWVGPVYKELSASLNKGFKAYYKKTYGKDVDITRATGRVAGLSGQSQSMGR
jgi:ABC-type sugar transport system substrate-binding protein